MAEDRGETRTFNLAEAFLFPKLFRGFRIAIDYRKLMLALAAIGLFYGVGVLCDWIGAGWAKQPPVVSGQALRPDGQQVIANEVEAVNLETVADFEGWKNRARTGRADALQARMARRNIGENADQRKRLAESDVNAAVGLLREKIWQQYHDAVKQANESQDPEARKAEDRLSAALARETALQELDQLDGEGVFEAFLGYQINRFNYAVQSLAFLPGGHANGWPGVWEGVSQMASAFVWLGKYHPVYAILLGVAWLLVSSLFGGAIARLAAVQAARDEKISVAEAMKFSLRKFISFLSAPLIPFVIVAIIFVLTAVPAMIAWIPAVGEIFVAVLGWLALIAGFIMALVVVGGVGGLGMMHPTIAVEGSDAFDAISRGFSYIYSRPWRTIFYNGLAILYGGLCFLFVKLFVFLMLWLSWSAMGALVWGGPAAATGGAIGGDKIAAMWAEPNIHNLHTVDWYKLQGIEGVGAVGLTIWVGIVISLLAAFVLSYVYSSQTLIYLLLRKRVDATDLDDVYIEETEEEELFEAPPEAAEEEGEAQETPPQEGEPKPEDQQQGEGEQKPEDQQQGEGQGGEGQGQ